VLHGRRGRDRDISAFSTNGLLTPEQTAEAMCKLNVGDYVVVWACQDSVARWTR